MAGWWVGTLSAGVLIALIVPYDTCYASSNVMPVNAVCIALISLLGVLGFALHPSNPIEPLKVADLFDDGGQEGLTPGHQRSQAPR